MLQVADPEVEDIVKPFGAQEISSGVLARCDGFGTARVGVVPVGFWCCIALTRPCYSLLFWKRMFTLHHCMVVLCYLFLIVQELIVKRLLLSPERLHLYFQH